MPSSSVGLHGTATTTAASAQRTRPLPPGCRTGREPWQKAARPVREVGDGLWMPWKSKTFFNIAHLVLYCKALSKTINSWLLGKGYNSIKLYHFIWWIDF